MPDILAMTDIDGLGGSVKASQPVNCHFRAYKSSDQALFSSTQDNIFLRHMGIYLLDKYFRVCGKYHNRHITMPLGEVYGENTFGHSVPIGMMTEFVYGSETSSFYNEHCDWKEVSKAFDDFGFHRFDYDLYSGFEGEADSLPHNFFSQNELFPEEKQCVFSPPPALLTIPKRYATSRWVRIDYLPDSFPCEEKKLISELKSVEVDLQKKLSPDEAYFLSQYSLILQNKKCDDKNKFDACIKKIRAANVQELLITQPAIAKRAGQAGYDYHGSQKEIDEVIQNTIQEDKRHFTLFKMPVKTDKMDDKKFSTMLSF